MTPVEAVPGLANLLGTFYQAGPELDTIAPQIAAPEVEGSLLRRLGVAPASTDADLHAVYQAMTVHVLNRMFGEE